MTQDGVRYDSGGHDPAVFGCTAEPPDSPLAELFPEPPQARSTPLADHPTAPSGRTVAIDPVGDADDLVTIRGASGEVELQIRMTEAGPVLRFRCADVQLQSTGAIRLDCEEFHLNARRGMVEETGGNLRVVVAGDASRSIRGDLHDEARTVEVRSRRGDVLIRANDDVRLNGERVKLNC